MQKGKPNKTQIDAIGRQLVRASALPAREVDKVISDPELFDRVRSRIMQDAAQSASKISGSSITVYLRRSAAAVSALAVLVIIAIGGINLFDNQKGKKFSAAKMSVPEVAVPDTVVRFDNPPVPAVGKLSSSRTTQSQEPENGIYVDRAVYRDTKSVEREAPLRKANMPKPRAAHTESEGEFYPLDGTSSVADKAEGGRIIRVDVARSSLFAMGVNVPLENESSVVKADLLVGPDGITRAIRVVK
jgi:hypothetical protein